MSEAKSEESAASVASLEPVVNAGARGLLCCPCGEYPNELAVVENGQGTKWLIVSGDCCSEWSIEFRNNYAPIDSNECRTNALMAWNAAPRKEQ